VPGYLEGTQGTGYFGAELVGWLKVGSDCKQLWVIFAPKSPAQGRHSVNVPVLTRRMKTEWIIPLGVRVDIHKMKVSGGCTVSNVSWILELQNGKGQRGSLGASCQSQLSKVLEIVLEVNRCTCTQGSLQIRKAAKTNSTSFP
jgi:hypothetical protein